VELAKSGSAVLEPGCWGCAGGLAGSIDTGVSFLFLQARKNARSCWLWEVGGRIWGGGVCWG